MQIRILGCGPSYGVPSLTRGFGLCDPTNPKNFRMRSSILVRHEHRNILIDSGPEVRLQLLNAGSPKLSAVLYTHEHYDHMGGADELRAVLTEDSKTLPVYLGENTAIHFKNMLSYLFQPHTQGKELLTLNIVQPYQTFSIDGLDVLPIPQRHGTGKSMGYRIGDLAYSTDVIEMEDRAFEALSGIKVWILGVVTPIQNDKHITVEKALEWIERVKPEKAYFTHMGARMDYARLCAELPPHIRPVYDGMEIDIC